MKPHALSSLGRWLKSLNYEFVTVTPESHRRVNERAQNAQAHNLRDVFGWSRRFMPGVLGHEGMALMRDAEALITRGDFLKSLVRFSTYRGLIFAHSAFPCARADSVFFGPDTYRFLRAIDSLPRTIARPGRIADIGTGSGAAGIHLAHMYPQADVVLADINTAALTFAAANADLNQCPNARVVNSDILKNIPGQFDLIVSNPPYLIDAAHRIYRHGGGALGHDLSLRILCEALDRLSAGGRLTLYTGSAVVDGRDIFRRKAEAVVAERGWDYSYTEVDPDVFGEELSTEAYRHADRLAAVVLRVTRP